jgi:hypothetical protein
MLFYKRFLIATGGLVAVTLLVFLGISIHNYDNAHPQKYICVKSHTKSKYVFGPSLGYDGKMGMHWHWEYTTICDKEDINPKWQKLHNN